MAFHWSIFLRAKWNFLWETPKSFRVDPEVFPKKKRGKNPARKIISLTLPVTSLPIKSFPVMQLPATSFPVTSGDATSGDVISGDVTAPCPSSTSNAYPIQHDIHLAMTGFELTT